MPQMIAAPTFQLPQLQAFSGGAQYTEAAANLANQLLQAYMKKLEIEKGDARSAELRDLLVSAGQPYMENLANITPESLEGLAVGADLTQIPEAQRLSTGEIPVGQALGFRAEQGPTGLPLAEEYMRPRIEPDPSTLPAIPNIDGTMPVTSSVAPQYVAAPVGPTDIIPQAQQDLRVIPEIDTAALPQFYTTAEGEKISVDDPNIDRPYIARDITPRQALMEALQGTDTKFRKSDFGPLEQVLFEDIMKAAPGQSKILSGKDLPPGFNKDAVVRQFTNQDGQSEWEVLQAGTAPKQPKDQFKQYSAKALHEKLNLPDTWLEQNEGKLFNYNEATNKIDPVSGGGITFKMPSSQEGAPVHDLITNIFENTGEAEEASGKLLSSVEKLDQLLDAGAMTGPREKWDQLARGFGYALGIGDEELEQKLALHSTFKAFANDVVLPRVKELGARPTDKDLQFIIDASPQIGNTVAGNRLILKSLRVKAMGALDNVRAWEDFLDFSANPESPFYNKDFAFASGDDVEKGNDTNWQFTGNPQLISKWKKYQRQREKEFEQSQAEEVGTLKQRIQELAAIEKQGLSPEKRNQLLREQNFIK